MPRFGLSLVDHAADSGGRRRRPGVRRALRVTGAWTRLPWLARAWGLALLGVLAGAPAARAQSGSVSGTVVDQSSLRPLSGVQVVLVGTRRGTVTDERGHFAIQAVPAGALQLRAVMLGYRTVAVTATAGQSDLRIVLETAPLSLDELVVTGTPGGTQRRAIGNSVTTVRASAVAATQPVSDVQELLNGRAPGVTFTEGTGRTGGGGVINIRGVSSISLSQQPLLYIDGVRVDNDVETGPRGQGNGIVSRLSDLNPDDIESIEVIKGPAAATLYGTEAAHGVIQVITKKGQFGQRPEFTAAIRMGTNWFMDPQGRIPTNYAKNAQGQILSWNGVTQEDARGTPIWKNGAVRNFNLSLAGGAERVRYYVGTSYDDDHGLTPDNKDNRFTGHATLTVSPDDKVDIQTSMNVVKSRMFLGSDYGLGDMFATMYGNPLLAGGPTRGFLLAPPEVIASVYQNTQVVNRFTGSVQISYHPVHWLTQQLRGGLDQTSEDNQALQNYLTAAEVAMLGPSTAKGYINQDLRNIAYITGDYSATATAALPRSIGSATSVGAQYYRRRTDLTQITARDFPLPGIITAAGAATVVGSQDYVNNTTIGVFGQQQFDLHNRLFLTGAVRVDNNSAFGQDFKWATYPKVSGSWLLSEEPFWHLDFLKDFRLRAAYGASGQQPIAFAALQTYQPTTGPGGRPIATPNLPGNPNLKPERGQELEAGFDAQVLGRLGLQLTYFNKHTNDAILQRPSPPSSGFPNPQYVNIGEIDNHGLELAADLDVLRGARLGWSIHGSLATAKDKIVNMGGLPFLSLTLPFQRNQQGYPVASYFSKRVLSATLTSSGATTNLLCDDGKGGSVDCAVAPAVFLGTPTPTYTGSVVNTFSVLKRIQLSALVDFRGGNKLFNADMFNRCAAFGLCDINMNPQKYPVTEVATIQRASTLVYTDALVQDASFAKLRELSASYTLPEAWAAHAGARGATFSLAARNLHTWTSYPGLDPERRAALTSDAQLLAFDQAILPPLAELVATLTVKF